MELIMTAKVTLQIANLLGGEIVKIDAGEKFAVIYCFDRDADLIIYPHQGVNIDYDNWLVVINIDVIEPWLEANPVPQSLTDDCEKYNSIKWSYEHGSIESFHEGDGIGSRRRSSIENVVWAYNPNGSERFRVSYAGQELSPRDATSEWLQEKFPAEQRHALAMKEWLERYYPELEEYDSTQVEETPEVDLQAVFEVYCSTYKPINFENFSSYWSWVQREFAVERLTLEQIADIFYEECLRE
jgi:hypothetical protein